MTSKIMLITIGKRDCHLVYEDSIQGKLRWSTTGETASQYVHLPILDPQGIIEKKKGIPSEWNVVGICFPMLSKALNYLKDSGESQLDYLFLISTNRKLLLPKLEKIKDLMEEAELIDDVYQYLEQGLIKHAREDTTSISAHLIEKMIRSKCIPLYDVSVKNVVVLDLGTYGFFDPLLDAPLNEPLDFNLLKKADINVIDFFESETFMSLKPFFKHMEEAKIYLATNSGGMPQMQKGVERVLKSTIAHAEYEQIYNSEFLWYQLESQPQEEFLLLLRQMTDNVIGLDWDSAFARFNTIKGKYAKKMGSTKIHKLEKLFASVIDRRKVSADQRWFDNFSTLIFQALYRMNMNDVVVWLKCLEEAAYSALLNKHRSNLWDKVETVPDESGIKRETVYINDPKTNKTIHVPAYPRNLASHYDKQVLLTAFEPYVKVFMKLTEFEHSKLWNDLRLVRNRLIHDGIPVTSDANNHLKILEFIDVDYKCLKSAIANVQSGNLKAIFEFEQSCMNNKFFKPLRIIAGSNNAVYTLAERKLCNQYLHELHS